MTDQEVALKAAQRSVGRAKQLEESGEEEAAEDCWREAERQYVAAGLDDDWFDVGALMEYLDENPPKMKARWLFPTTFVEVAYEPGADGPSGLVVSIEDLGDIVP